MALRRTKLLGIQSVTGINTVGIFTAGVTPTPVGTASTTYLRGVIMHNTGASNAVSSLYIYPNGVSASGPAQPSYRIARIDLSANETFFFECSYPIVLTNQDKIVVEVTQSSTAGSGIGSAVNYQILGDTDI